MCILFKQSRHVGFSRYYRKKWSQISDSDVFIGASIYAGTIDGRLHSFLSALRSEQVKRVVVFGTSAGKKTALTEIKAILEPNGLIVMEDEFHCMGAFLFANRGRPNEEDIERAELFARTICGGQL